MIFIDKPVYKMYNIIVNVIHRFFDGEGYVIVDI